MSATNRGATRNERDFYATPMSAYAPLLPYLPNTLEYWEPACGDGRLIAWSQQAGLTMRGTDIAPNNGFGAPTDFLKDETLREFIVTNPPFSIAQAFASHALSRAREVMLLLPLGFLGSSKRRDWWKANETSALFPLSERPSFAMHVKCRDCGHSEYFPTGTKRPKACSKCTSFEISISTTDAQDYAWFYWGRRWHGTIHL